MTTRRWHIRDHATLGVALAHIEAAQLPCVVTIKEGEEKRRERQNRFSHEVYAQVARLLGDRSTSDVRAESKLHVGVAILRAHDEAFRAKYDQHIKPLPYETKLAVMVEPLELPVTSLMGVKVMAEYLTALLQYWDDRGASAMMPETP